MISSEICPIGRIDHRSIPFTTMIKTTIPIGILLLAASSLHGASLAAYDAAIAGSGFTARSTTAATFDGTNIEAFDFGAIAGDATFEFIISGDPDGGGRNGYIGRADANPANSLRYEQWDNTGQLGFTRAGVADNAFTALDAASPSVDTHVTYRWTQATGTMDLFINGAATDSIAGATFDMPTGPGHLGNVSAGGNEGMIGTISRVTTFNSALPDSEIAAHSGAWSVPEPSSVLLSSIAFLALLRRRR